MSRLKILLALIVFVVPLLRLQAQSGSAPQLPPAPIQPKVMTACMECHDSGILVQQRLDKKTWGKEVDKMTKWGALVEKEDRDAFIDYLSSNFGPDKPPAAPEYKLAAPKTTKAAPKKD
ncbi:MAG: hypothetical protein ACR2IF_12995 [Terriglobales bacterium]